MTTAKALMINTAFRYDFTGQNHDLTRVHQGWGMPDLEELYNYRDKIVIIDETDVLLPLATNSYNIGVLPGEANLRVTMTYADPPGVPSSSQHRINDLTLKVTSPSGVVYWGNNGLLEGNVSTPDGDPNDYDTVENVFIANPEDGSWTVEVMAMEINQDSHVETPGLDADYALVITGGLEGPAFAIRPDAPLQSVCAPADGVYTLNIDQILDFSEPVTLSASDNPAGTTVNFSSNPVTPGNTVTMTVTNTNGATPGDYLISVTGTAGDLVKTTLVGLNISNQVPASPTGTAPVNGAVEVSRQPNFEWGAADQAQTYQLQVATDIAFTNLIIDETLTGIGYMDGGLLQSLTTYYWRTNATNGCGTSQWSGPYNFTTIDQPDYMTEQFGSNNDLTNRTAAFVPNGAGDFYNHCSWESTELPNPTTGATVVSLSDDDFETVSLNRAVPFYGTDYSTIFIGSNGFVTFDSGATTTGESLGNHFNRIQIAGLFDDLNPATGGTVSYEELADKLVITYDGVPQFSSSDNNTFQIEIFYEGEIRITWTNIDATDGLAGLSNGGGTPPDFAPTDLTGEGSCDAACFGDINGDGSINGDDMHPMRQGWNGEGLGDLDGDGYITVKDMVGLMDLFGSCGAN